MVAFENLAQLSVVFPHLGEKTLPIFRASSGDGRFRAVRAAVVYGRNGAGKSSIARALKHPENSVKFLDSAGKEINPPRDPISTAVFDQDFVDENVRLIHSSGLEPIVMLGSQVQENELLETKLREKAQAGRALSKMEEKMKAKRERVVKHEVSLKEKLKGEGGFQRTSWKERSARISRTKRPKNLTKATLECIQNLKPSASDLKNLDRELERKIESLESLRAVPEIEWQPPEIALELKSAAAEEATKLLKRDVHRTGSEVLRRIQSCNQSATNLREKAQTLFSEDSDFCPHCFQAMSEDYKQSARDAIDLIVSEIQRLAESANLNQYMAAWDASIDLPRELYIEAAVAEEIEGVCSELNQIRDSYNSQLAEKAENPDCEVGFEFEKFDSLVRDRERLIRQVIAAVERHNVEAKRIEELEREADHLNNLVAAIETADVIKELGESRDKLYAYDLKVKAQKAKFEQLESDISKLRSDEKRETRAAYHINELLKIVQGGEAIQLEAFDGAYRVTNRGLSVSPGKLSTGEMNILALCYFFATLGEGGKFEDGFKRQQLVVLDDPISSFDFDNKYGVTSLLGRVCREMFDDGGPGKLAILTHDQSVAADLSKVLNGVLSGGELNWEFCNGSLQNKSFESLDVYRDILVRMYRLGVKCEQDVTPLKSNEVRRVWEAFVRFELDENPTDASKSEKVRKHLENCGSSHTEFFKNYAGRVFMNPDSHSASQVMRFSFELAPALGASDFQRYVLETMCFMHMLSPLHVPSRLAKDFSFDTVKAGLDDAVANLLNQETVLSG